LEKPTQYWFSNKKTNSLIWHKKRIIDELKKNDSGPFREMNTKDRFFIIPGLFKWKVKWFKKGSSLKSEDVANLFFQTIIRT
jgi:hypothetical protein